MRSSGSTKRISSGRVDLDIGRLEVAMDDALLVRRLESSGELSRSLESVAGREISARQSLRERLAGEVLHDEIVAASGRR
jgi:hypothetical protein